LQNEELYKSVSGKVRKNIEQRFDIRIVVDQYEQVYRTILKEGR